MYEGLYYHKSFCTHKGRIEMTFIDYSLPRISNGIILDWGCSKGDTTHDLKEMYGNCEVIGIDMNPKLIDYASKTHKDCKFLVMDGFNPQFSKEYFDAIFCLNNLYYTLAQSEDRKNLKNSFENIKNLVKEKGFLIISGEPDDEMVPNFIVLKRKTDKFVPERIKFDKFGEAKKCLERILKLI